MVENDRILFQVKIKKYDDDLYKLICFPDKTKRDKYPNLFKITNIPQPLKYYKSFESISRTKSKIFEYIYCNDFDYFLTFTLNPDKHNVYDLKNYISKLSRFLRYYRSQYNSNIQYLIIPERHKSGSWHFHGVIKGIPSSKLSINENGYLDWLDYRSRFGFVSLSPIKSKLAASRYITKYVTKTLIDSKDSKSYYVSRNLNTAQDIYHCFGYNDQYEFSKMFFGISYDFTNKYCMLKYFDRDFYNFLFNSKVSDYQKQCDLINEDIRCFGDYLS